MFSWDTGQGAHFKIRRQQHRQEGHVLAGLNITIVQVHRARGRCPHVSKLWQASGSMASSPLCWLAASCTCLPKRPCLCTADVSTESDLKCFISCSGLGPELHLQQKLSTHEKKQENTLFLVAHQIDSCQKGRCYDLNRKCPSQTYVLNVCTSARLEISLIG